MLAPAANDLLSTLERHYDELVAYVRRRFHEHGGGFAREVVHDLCVQVLEAPPVHALHTPLAWLRVASSHRAIDRCRADAHRLALIEPVAELPEVHADHHDGASALAFQQHLASLVRIVEALPPRARQVFLLQRIHGVPQQEIAEAMGISRNMVAQHHSRAMRTIAAEWEPARERACGAVRATARTEEGHGMGVE